MRQSRRRQFLIASGAMLVLPRLVIAQTRIHRVAFLAIGTARISMPYQKILFSRLAELGHSEGQNLVVDRRFANGDLRQLSVLATEIVALKPDVTVTVSTPSTLAMVKATRSIPIVFVAVADPVGAGIVQSLARPGGNATGISAFNVATQTKQLQMLKEMLPAAARVTVLLNPLNRAEIQVGELLKAEAPKLGFSLQMVEVDSEAAFSQAFKSIEDARPDVLFIVQGVFAQTHAARIMEFASARKLPVVGGAPNFVEAGTVMAYLISTDEPFRQAAAQVAKILGGTRPADIPVQQVSVFELVINLKSARALGIKIPQSLLIRADRVIE